MANDLWLRIPFTPVRISELALRHGEGFACFRWACVSYPKITARMTGWDNVVMLDIWRHR